MHKICTFHELQCIPAQACLCVGLIRDLYSYVSSQSAAARFLFVVLHVENSLEQV